MNTLTLPVLTGTAVTLRPNHRRDTDLIVKWRNTPSVVQNFIFRQTFTPEMHRSWLATKGRHRPGCAVYHPRQR